MSNPGLPLIDSLPIPAKGATGPARFLRAAVVNPPNPPGYTSNKDSMGGFGQLYGAGAPPAPALDLPYLAASLREAKVLVSVLEAGADRDDVDTFLHKVRALPDLERTVLFVRTSLPTVDWDLRICERIRSECRAGGIALIGAVIGSVWQRVQQDRHLDFAIAGEPDGPALQLIQGTPLDQINGLRHRVDGEWVVNADRAFERDLDRLPFPAWDLFPHEKYVIPRSANSGEMRFLPMLASRGCPFGCSYCPYPVGQGLQWRFRSPKNVVDEMEHLIEAFGIEYVLFRDPMFSARKQRVREICDEILSRGLELNWRCETRIDCLDEPTIARMAEAGCTGVNFGVESIDPEIQRGVERRPITVEEFRAKIALCRRYEIQTFAFFIVGLPGDTVRTILDSIAFAIELGANWVQFTVSTPFAGTKLHEWAVSQGRIPPDFYKIVSSHEGSVGNENLSASDIHRLHVFAQFLQNNLINRRGVLKNHRRTDMLYVTAKRAADFVAPAVAAALVRGARWYFGRVLDAPTAVGQAA